MPVSPVFQRLLSAGQIEDKARESLKKWFPTYLREVESQLDLPTGYFPAPNNYSDRNAFDMEAAEELPKVVVISPGIMGTPQKKGDGTFEAIWRLGIGLAAGARTEEDANRLVKGYGAAVRGIMLQNSELGDIGAIDITWSDEAYDDIPVPNPNVQLVKAASIYFDIIITDVVTRTQGPVTPNDDPYSYGEVQTVVIDLVKEEIISG